MDDKIYVTNCLGMQASVFANCELLKQRTTLIFFEESKKICEEIFIREALSKGRVFLWMGIVRTRDLWNLLIMSRSIMSVKPGLRSRTTSISTVENRGKFEAVAMSTSPFTRRERSCLCDILSRNQSAVVLTGLDLEFLL